MSSKACRNKNYTESEYRDLNRRMWEAFDICGDYKCTLTPEEFFLAGFI